MKLGTLALAVGALMATLTAEAFAQAKIDPNTWVYGPRNNATTPTVEIWNPAMKKLKEGGQLFGGTIRATDPRTYCSMANAGYDFTWVEMQHEHITWEQVARMWKACPGAKAVPGVRVAYTDEREIQHALDGGALALIVPTVDTVEEAREVVKWAMFPPLGRRSSGGGQGPSEMWNRVPGGYRGTINDNLILIVMIETLEGVANAREIAKVKGITGIFAASGDIGNFSGYREGDPQYEMLITEIHDAAMAAGVKLCGPARWAFERKNYSCLQAGTEAAAIARGVAAELNPPKP